MDSISSLPFETHYNQTNDPLESLLFTLSGNNNFNELGPLPTKFTPQSQKDWKGTIDAALLKGLKDTNQHPVLLEVIRELAKRKYDLNQPMYDLIDPICPGIDVGRPFIYLACSKGPACFSIIYEMLTMEEIDINAETTKGANLLWSAAFNGHLVLIEFLLGDPRIDPNKPNKDDATPFLVACQENRFEVIERLLSDHRVDPNKPDSQKASPFFRACQNNALEVVEVILRQTNIDLNQATKDQETPFLTACKNGCLSIVDRLLKDIRIDPTKPSGSHLTPFYYACQSGHSDVVKRLLQDPRIDPNKWQTSSTLTELINNNPNNPSPLYYLDIDFEVMKLLLINPRINEEQLCSVQFMNLFHLIDIPKEKVELCLAAAYRKPALQAHILAQITSSMEIREFYKPANDVQLEKLILEYYNDKSKREQIGLDLFKKYYGVEESAQIFAATVLTSDNYLALKTGAMAQAWLRFMRIATQLPMELQMILANRVWGLPADIVKSKDFEEGLKSILLLYQENPQNPTISTKFVAFLKSFF